MNEEQINKSFQIASEEEEPDLKEPEYRCKHESVSISMDYPSSVKKCNRCGKNTKDQPDFNHEEQAENSYRDKINQ